MKPKRKPIRKPRTFDEYLEGLEADKRAALEKIRLTIHAAVSAASECVDYGLAAFRLNGRHFVALGASAKHCAFYLGSTVQAHKDELRGFDIGRGTVRFQAGHAPPASLVRKLVRARIAENHRFGPGA
jgi:uncharacterized protein YdhG (YjbR/CyaY superfamily)